MKLTNIKTNKAKSGMTLIELTVVILVLLSLISVLFVGARAWLRGSDRAQAAIFIRNAQQGCRSHCNIIGVNPPGLDTSMMPPAPAFTGLEALFRVQTGDPLATPPTVPGTNSPLLAQAVFGPGAFVETVTAGMPPAHPANSVNFRDGINGTNFELVPSIGSVYMTSSANSEFYEPTGLQ